MTLSLWVVDGLRNDSPKQIEGEGDEGIQHDRHEDAQDQYDDGTHVAASSSGLTAGMTGGVD